jgi:hypothetical protein
MSAGTTERLRALTLSLLAMVALVGSVLAVGVAPVAADHSGNTSTDVVEQRNVTVTDDDRSVFVEAANVTNGGTQADLYVHVSGIDNGSMTQVAEGTVSAGANATDLFEASVNATKYGEYHVEVRAANETTYEDLSIGTISKVSGGGGFVSGSGLSATMFGIPVVLLGAAALYLYTRED